MGSRGHLAHLVIYQRANATIAKYESDCYADPLFRGEAGAIAAFVWGWRRNAITVPLIGRVGGGWLFGGLATAGYARLVCSISSRLDLWLWSALAGFLVLPQIF